MFITENLDNTDRSKKKIEIHISLIPRENESLHFGP